MSTEPGKRPGARIFASCSTVATRIFADCCVPAIVSERGSDIIVSESNRGSLVGERGLRIEE